MAPPTAMTTADSNNAGNTDETALLLHVLFKPKSVSPFNRNKKGNGEALDQLHKFDVVHTCRAVELDIYGGSR